MFRKAAVMTLSLAAVATAGAGTAHAAQDPPIAGLPTGKDITYENPVVRDGGIAVVVTNEDAGTLELFGAKAGEQPKSLARCEKVEFEELEVAVPAVSGGTVAWQPCAKPGKPPEEAVAVYDASGTRTFAAKGSNLPEYALAGRTLAFVDDAQLRLTDLDSGASRVVAVPGKGNIIKAAGQADGTVVATRSKADGESYDACGKITASVIRPGATSAATIPDVTCSRDIVVAADTIAYLRATKTGFPSLEVRALDGSNRRVLDANMNDSFGPAVTTDGGNLSWTHHGCAADRDVTYPITALPKDLSESCPVRIRSARLTSKGKLAVAVSCPNACRKATLAVGIGAPKRIGLRKAGTRTVSLRLTAAERKTLRRAVKPRVQLTVGATPAESAFPFKQTKVAVRGA